MHSLKKFILILCLLPSVCSTAQNSNTYKYSHYTGKIGKDLAITADLCFENDSAITGYYYYDKFGIPIRLQGTVLSDKSFLIYEMNKDFEKTAEIKTALMKDGKVKGTFNKLKTKKKYKISLSNTSADGAVSLQGYTLQEKQKLFNSETSPECKIKFSMLLPNENENKLIYDSLTRIVNHGFFSIIPPGDPAQKLSMCADSVFKAYRDANPDTSSSAQYFYMLSWDYISEVKVIHNSHNLLSLEFSVYYYTGGAHGGYGAVYKNADITTGKTILLQDIFITGFDKPLKKELNKNLRDLYELKPGDKLTDLGYWDDSVDVPDNFYLTTKGIGFFFNPYEVACYATGTTDVFVPFSDLSAIMNEDFLKKISEK
jgi:hypothetical protein